MTTVIIGATGQLGMELAATLPGPLTAFGRADVDLTDAASVERALGSVNPNIVINAAAYNLVDRAEDEPELAYAVNAVGPRHLASCCAKRDIPLLHVSSDFVFGLDAERNRPYHEDEAPGPISAYGTSKLAGEYFVRSLCSKHFVVRTCGLYGTNSRHGNFVETMLRLARERKKLRVVNDQRCTPTAVKDLARAIQMLIGTVEYGLYHATNAGETTWYDFAKEIFRLQKIDADLTPITTSEYGAKAKRPAYSVLDCSKVQHVTGWRPPSWQNALAEYLERRDL